jgi:hypothetical protein
MQNGSTYWKLLNEVASEELLTDTEKQLNLIKGELG